MGSYTGMIVKQCPEFSNLFMTEGGAWDEHVGCRIGEQGSVSCEKDDSDFCMDGEDFSCPAGTVRKATPGTAEGNSLDNCEVCAAGS